MPRSPKKECRASRCKNRQLSNGYCEEHKHLSVGWFKTSKQSRHERGYGTEWDKARCIKLSTQPLCEYCLERGIYKPAAEVDHILALAHGGSHRQENLKSTCKPCHKIKTAQDRAKSVKGVGGSKV